MTKESTVIPGSHKPLGLSYLVSIRSLRPRCERHTVQLGAKPAAAPRSSGPDLVSMLTLTCSFRCFILGQDADGILATLALVVKQEAHSADRTSIQCIFSHVFLFHSRPGCGRNPGRPGAQSCRSTFQWTRIVLTACSHMSLFRCFVSAQDAERILGPSCVRGAASLIQRTGHFLIAFSPTSFPSSRFRPGGGQNPDQGGARAAAECRTPTQRTRSIPDTYPYRCSVFRPGRGRNPGQARARGPRLSGPDLFSSIILTRLFRCSVSAQDADGILAKLARELQQDPDSADAQRYDVALERAMACLLLGQVDDAKGHLGLNTDPPTGGHSYF